MWKCIVRFFFGSRYIVFVLFLPFCLRRCRSTGRWRYITSLNVLRLRGRQFKKGENPSFIKKKNERRNWTGRRISRTQATTRILCFSCPSSNWQQPTTSSNWSVKSWQHMLLQFSSSTYCEIVCFSFPFKISFTFFWTQRESHLPRWCSTTCKKEANLFNLFTKDTTINGSAET